MPYIFNVPTIYFVNTDLQLELHINVRRYNYSSKVHGEGNSVITGKSFQKQDRAYLFHIC